jgi:hypothetical protein
MGNPQVSERNWLGCVCRLTRGNGNVVQFGPKLLQGGLIKLCVYLQSHSL